MVKETKEKTKITEKVKAEKKTKQITEKEVKKKILDLAKEGLTAEKIGQKLKDQGIHIKEFKLKLKEVLGEAYINPDLKNVEEKLERIKKHYEKNKQDKRAKREKDRIFSQVRKLKKYFGIAIKK